MSDVNSGTATAAYILDITDVERKATQLRTILAGVRNDAVAPAASPVAASAAPQQSTAINENAAALSRQALAAGDAAGAVDLMNQALGKSTEQEKQNTTATEASVRAQAALRVALGDTIGAIELLEAAHAQSVTGSTEEVAIARQLAQIENQGLAATQRAADAEIRLAQERARAAVAVKDYTGALEILNGVQTEGASTQTVAALETQIAATETAGTATGALGAQFVSLANPVVIATAAIGASVAILKSFNDAVHFAGQLQEERTAFGGVIGDFQKGNLTLDEATKRTRVFGFTQKETTDAFRELAPIIRESTSSTKDQAEALARIAILKPDAPVQALSTAIEGIQTGNIRALSKELGLTKDEQILLKQSTDRGTDAFVALNAVLDKHGITLAVARDRMQGQAGAEREAALATEDLTKAEAAYAAGPGLVFTQAKTLALNALTDTLGNSSKSVDGFSGAIGAEIAQLLFAKQATDGLSTANAQNGQDLVKQLGITADVTIETNKFSGAVAGVGNDLRRTAAATIDSSAAARSYADALALPAIQARAGALANQQKSDSDKIAAIDAQTHGIAEEHLAQQAQDAARALIDAGPAGARTAAVLAASSQQVDIATAAYYRLFAAQQSTRPGATQQQAADFRSQELFGRTATQTTEALQRQTAADRARSQGILQNGSAVQKVAELQRLYNDAVRQSGPNSAEAINAQNALIAAETSAGKTRVSAAATTGLQLAQTEENSQAAILKAQREGLERLRDSQEDFDLHRARNQQDEDLKIQSLLAHGQRAQAEEERKKFALDQQRNQEDFNIARQRTLRNNAESTGDIDTRTDLRQQQIGQRAALRGVRPAGGGGGGAGLPGTPTFIPDAPVRATQPIVIRFQPPPANIQINGETLVTVTWPFFEQRIDTELAAALAAVPPPGGGQTAVAGGRP